MDRTVDWLLASKEPLSISQLAIRHVGKSAVVYTAGIEGAFYVHVGYQSLLGRHVGRVLLSSDVSPFEENVVHCEIGAYQFPRLNDRCDLIIGEYSQVLALSDESARTLFKAGVSNMERASIVPGPDRFITLSCPVSRCITHVRSGRNAHTLIFIPF